MRNTTTVTSFWGHKTRIPSRGSRWQKGGGEVGVGRVCWFHAGDFGVVNHFSVIVIYLRLIKVMGQWHISELGGAECTLTNVAPITLDSYKTWVEKGAPRGNAPSVVWGSGMTFLFLMKSRNIVEISLRIHLG